MLNIQHQQIPHLHNLGGSMQQVAVYGTLRSHKIESQSRSSLLNASMFKGMANLPDNIGLFNLGPFPFVQEVEEPITNPVVCEVYEINDRVLSILDGIEGHPDFYERKLVDIEGHKEAWVYFLDGEGTSNPIISGDWTVR